jgi:hypothetical protein
LRVLHGLRGVASARAALTPLATRGYRSLLGQLRQDRASLGVAYATEEGIESAQLSQNEVARSLELVRRVPDEERIEEVDIDDVVLVGANVENGNLLGQGQRDEYPD